MRWAFVGSGPSAPQQLRDILPKLRPCRTITTNAAIKLFQPDVYFLTDQVACRKFSHMAAQLKGKTHLVTMHRDPKAQEARNVQWFDEFILNGLDPPLPNRWGSFNMSGPFCLEYACRNGASEMHLLGCEGYAETSYFDQAERQASEFKPADAMTNKQLVKRMTMVVECFPSVPFYVYGPTHYSIPLPNWHEQIAI